MSKTCCICKTDIKRGEVCNPCWVRIETLPRSIWPKWCQRSTFEQSDPAIMPQNAQNWRVLDNWVAGQGNMYLWGLNGTGKTYAACCVINKLRSENLWTAGYFRACDLAEFAIDKVGELRRLAHMDLLLIDDLDKLYVNGKSSWLANKLFNFLDMRHPSRNHRVTIVTSNVSGKKLSDHFVKHCEGNTSVVDGAFSRLWNPTYMEMKGEDLRYKNGQ